VLIRLNALIDDHGVRQLVLAFVPQRQTVDRAMDAVSSDEAADVYFCLITKNL
jgi:hypothetical protein